MARILRRPEVQALVGLSKAQIYKLISRSEFPRPRRLTPSGKAVGWLESEISEWIDSRPVATP